MGFQGDVMHMYNYTEYKGHVFEDKVSMLGGDIPLAPSTVIKNACFLNFKTYLRMFIQPIFQ